MSLLGRGEKNGQGNHRPGETIQVGRRYSLTRGKGHVIEEHQGAMCYEFLSDFLSKNGAANARCLVVSRQHPGSIRAKYRLEGVRMIWLATQPGEGTIDPTSLNTLAHEVEDFLSKGEGGIVMVDGIEYLVTNNDFKKVVRMIEQVNDSVMSYHGYLLISIDPRTFDPKELAILEKNYEIIHTRGSSNGSG